MCAQAMREPTMESEPQVTSTDGSPLLKAVYLGRLRLTRLLLEGGAYINESNSLGETPLMVTCKSKWQDQQSVPRAKMVRYLMECGADPNIQDKSGKTALMHACLEQAGAEVVSQLLENGADPSLEDHSGSSALVHAVNARDKMTLRMLMDACKAKGKEVIIITTTVDGTCDHKPITKQYLNVPPTDTLEQWDWVKSPGLPCASPSQIELQTTALNGTSHNGGSAPAKQVFSFQVNEAATSSHPSSPCRQLGVTHEAAERFAQLQRLNSEPWLQMPRSFSSHYQHQQQTGRASSPNKDLSSLNSYSKDHEGGHLFGNMLPEFTSCPLTRHGSIDLRETDGLSRAIPTNQADECAAVGESLEQGFALMPNRKMSFDALSSAHSLSHPNLHARSTVEQLSSADRTPSKLLPPSLAVSSLRNIVCRRQNLGMDHYGSDSQLSFQRGNSSEEFPRAGLDRKRLVTSRSSTFIGLRESTEGGAEQTQHVGVKLKHPTSTLERRSSGIILSDSPPHPRQGYLPPLCQQALTASSSNGVSILGTPTHNNHKLGLCAATSGVKLGHHPQAPSVLLKDPKSRKLLLRRHSMQTDQLKEFGDFKEIYGH